MNAKNFKEFYTKLKASDEIYNACRAFMKTYNTLNDACMTRDIHVSKANPYSWNLEKRVHKAKERHDKAREALKDLIYQDPNLTKRYLNLRNELNFCPLKSGKAFALELMRERVRLARKKELLDG